MPLRETHDFDDDGGIRAAFFRWNLSEPAVPALPTDGERTFSLKWI